MKAWILCLAAVVMFTVSSHASAARLDFPWQAFPDINTQANLMVTYDEEANILEIATDNSSFFQYTAFAGESPTSQFSGDFFLQAEIDEDGNLVLDGPNSLKIENVGGGSSNGNVPPNAVLIEADIVDFGFAFGDNGFLDFRLDLTTVNNDLGFFGTFDDTFVAGTILTVGQSHDFVDWETDWSGPNYNSVADTFVPEPATVGLFALAVAAMLGRRRWP